MNENSEYHSRIKKVNEMRELGINPYPEKFDKKQNIIEIKDILEDRECRPLKEVSLDPQKEISTAGRLMLIRPHGGLVFGKIKDELGEIQIMLNKQNCKIIVKDGESVGEINGISAYKLFLKLVDAGDRIGVQGELFKTLRGESTIFVSDYQILTKSISPLGDKFHGIEDQDTRYRKRYLDVIFNDEVRDMLHRRSVFWQSMREFLMQKQFLEVETPILENTTGGADANPFITHHNALDLDVNLRISCGELRQKRLMVAGFEKTFEIGRIFRNEGMSPEHAQDYTQMENYRAFADYKQMMVLVRDMYLHIIDKVYGKRKFSIKGYEVNFDQEREEIDYVSIIQEKTGISIFEESDEVIEQRLDELGVKYDPQNRSRLIDALRKYCRKEITGPAFLINVPTFISPLAKSKVENPELTNRFQVIIAGSEIGNGFSELNDPLDQRKRFEQQQAMRDAGDQEAQMADWEYVEALEHGMPPTAGFGVSERLFSFLEDKPIRESQYFPLMKPIQKNN